MAGLKGQARLPNASPDPRVRRNAAGLATNVLFIGANEVIQLNGEGELTLALKADGGLLNDAAKLTVLLNSTTPCLSLSGGMNVTVVTGSFITKNATGLDLDLENQSKWIEYYVKGAV